MCSFFFRANMMTTSLERKLLPYLWAKWLLIAMEDRMLFPLQPLLNIRPSPMDPMKTFKSFRMEPPMDSFQVTLLSLTLLWRHFHTFLPTRFKQRRFTRFLPYFITLILLFRNISRKTVPDFVNPLVCRFSRKKLERQIVEKWLE